jgi:hypothetical protein
MDTSIIGLIVIAAVGVVLLLAAIAWMMLIKPHQYRRDPDMIREDAGREALAVRRQEALDDQLFADGRRAARADADADAAHAVRVRRRLDGDRVGAHTSRHDLNGHRDVADAMSDRPDPRRTEI